MILVVLGTWSTPFIRPLIEVENLVKNGYLKTHVIVQSGNTIYNSKYIEIVPFFNSEEFDKKYQEASFIITHAGAGSIMHGLKYNKKMIAIARRSKYNEHIDDHQMDILYTFSSKGYILPWYENEDLLVPINKLNTFIPNIYPFGKGKILETIIKYLEK